MERCGFTSKLLSWTTDDCHPWHSNLCHGQMTTFILTVDRYVILKRLIEEAQKSGSLTFTSWPMSFTEVFSVSQFFKITCHSYKETIQGLI